MNRRGFFASYFLAPIFIIIFLYAWIFIFGPPLAELGTNLANSQGMTGLEGFVWRTINIWVGFLTLIVYIMYVAAYGGSQ